MAWGNAKAGFCLDMMAFPLLFFLQSMRMILNMYGIFQGKNE